MVLLYGLGVSNTLQIGLIEQSTNPWAADQSDLEAKDEGSRGPAHEGTGS